ncbi:Gfo/Idh/MocA family oxidoreductase [Phytoactinopolyspora alkaliphila]|uniref:Inositol 2-dehydrogenase n=1 Tax=Phytoactinopolyspora alkaliphila TaxID=1783498 RepID=A0A6N9YPK0_9ACTN|nr:Gfo/Idh/MocA family oxidoreductase [Phytoactinopolyspora alkaliphila]NED96749.1 Gfo/Idh/MocA family oxidoreductase [Phytoactinopolyspora alkaliphila]
MTVRVGVIGVGMIGQDHIRRLTGVLAGARVVAVADVDPERARQVAGQAIGVTVHATGLDVIADDDVDAVLVASWGATHEEYVVACIQAGKPVFCEKPLAPSGEAAGRIVDAEVAAGRRLVQLGFMRRYDPGYLALREVVAGGSIGAALLVHCAHRNPTVQPHYVADMAITDTAVHEFDVVRWLLDEEITAVTVHRPRPNRHGGDVQDPLLLLLETESGAFVDLETSVNIRYGYDIRTEVVGEDGTVELGPVAPVVVRREGIQGSPIAADWQERFEKAYDVELQHWIDSVVAGTAVGPSTWDGYAAAVVSDAGLTSLHRGGRVPVALRDKPGLYLKDR